MDLGSTSNTEHGADGWPHPAGADASEISAQPMKISIVGCPFRTTYGGYITALRAGLQRTAGSPVQWVASNCGCGDPIEISRQFQGQDCDYFEMPSTIGRWNIVGYSPNPVKRALKSGVRNLGNAMRAARYADLAPQADIIHLQQTLGAFGSDIAFRLLRRRLDAARVITLHELDSEQTDFPERNLTYNLADGLIVHDSWMKDRLIGLGVEADLIHVVRCGTDLTEGEPLPRDGIVFYGGHNLNKGKGLTVLLQAYRLLKDRAAVPLPRLRIHGHYGVTAPADWLAVAAEHGVAEDLDWLNELPMEATVRLYRRSQVCVLPFSGSFAGLPVGVAAANRLPVIATRFAGVPDHIGDLAVWIDGKDPVELADRMQEILGDAALARTHGDRLRAHAEQYLGWDSVARETLEVYRAAHERALIRRG